MTPNPKEVMVVLAISGAHEPSKVAKERVTSVPSMAHRATEGGSMRPWCHVNTN